MRSADIYAVMDGSLPFEAFLARSEKYFVRMAGYFYRRASWANLPLDEHDLVQIGIEACWKAVSSYRWRCPLCRRQAATQAQFARHAEQSHAVPELKPKPTPKQWLHGRTGSAIDHEVTKHVRRSKWHVSLPEDYRTRTIEERCGSALNSEPPVQEAVVELSQLVEAARERLTEKRFACLVALMEGRPLAEVVGKQSKRFESDLHAEMIALGNRR